MEKSWRCQFLSSMQLIGLDPGEIDGRSPPWAAFAHRLRMILDAAHSNGNLIREQLQRVPRADFPADYRTSHDCSVPGDREHPVDRHAKELGARRQLAPPRH